MPYLCVPCNLRQIRDPLQEIRCKVTYSQNTRSVPIGVVAESMDTNVPKLWILWKPFLRPKERRIRVLRPGLERPTTEAVYEDDVSYCIGERSVDGRQAYRSYSVLTFGFAVRS